MSEDCDMIDYYMNIPAGFGLQSVYIDVALCLPAGISSTCGCYHMVRYSDGRRSLASGDSICKMFLNRRQPVDDHFKKYINHICVKRSASGTRYFSTIPR